MINELRQRRTFDNVPEPAAQGLLAKFPLPVGSILPPSASANRWSDTFTPARLDRVRRAGALITRARHGRWPYLALRGALGRAGDTDSSHGPHDAASPALLKETFG